MIAAVALPVKRPRVSANVIPAKVENRCRILGASRGTGYLIAQRKACLTLRAFLPARQCWPPGCWWWVPQSTAWRDGCSDVNRKISRPKYV